MVKLKAKDTQSVSSFGIAQAEQMLRLRNSQWELADENYEYKDNAIIRRKNKKAGSKTAKDDV